MGDERLRELERRFKQSRSVFDETAYLAARLRAGELPPGRLALAAFVGHDAARAVLGPAAPTAPAGLAGWLRELERWGLGVVVRALIAGGRARLATLVPEQEEHAAAAALVEAAEAWVVCPCERHARATFACAAALSEGAPISRAELLEDALGDVLGGEDSAALARLSPQQLRQRAEELAPAGRIEAGVLAATLLTWTAHWGRGLLPAPPPQLDPIRHALRSLTRAGLAEERLRAAIRDELVPWVLDRHDPVLARAG